MYINDIIKASTNGHFVLFADDTNIFVAANTEAGVYQTANEILVAIHRYMLSNQLHINLGKCTYIHFRSGYNNKERLTCARARPYGNEPTLSLNGTKLKKVDQTRFLGIIIDENLTWDSHIRFLEAKLNLL